MSFPVVSDEYGWFEVALCAWKSSLSLGVNGKRTTQQEQVTEQAKNVDG
jgi:hypothetical protein